ncbi:nuclear transport factor 2 family protein [Pseudomonas sp. 1152_12]
MKDGPHFASKTCDKESLIKASAGANAALNDAPASVRLTLRVVRLNSRTLSCASILLIVRDTAFRPSPEAQGVIVNIDIVGTAASVRIDTTDVSDFCFTDFFNRLKVDGKWTVVSKIYYTHPKH